MFISFKISAQPAPPLVNLGGCTFGIKGASPQDCNEEFDFYLHFDGTSLPYDDFDFFVNFDDAEFELTDLGDFTQNPLTEELSITNLYINSHYLTEPAFYFSGKKKPGISQVTFDVAILRVPANSSTTQTLFFEVATPGYQVITANPTTGTDCTTLYGTQLLTPAQALTQPQFLIIGGKLNINDAANPYTFARGSEILFQPGASIAIKSGAVLSVRSNTNLMSTDCSLRWNGITVENGGSLDLSSVWPFLPKGIFKDANTAIYLENNSSLSANFFDFFNNPTVVQTHNNNGSKQQLNFSVIGCRFYAPKNPNSFPQIPKAMKLYDLNESVIRSWKGWPLYIETRFEGWPVAVDASNCDLDFLQVNFENLGYGILAKKGSDITVAGKHYSPPNTIPGCFPDYDDFHKMDYGIHASNSTIDVFGVEMDEIGKTGIRSYHGNSLGLHTRLYQSCIDSKNIGVDIQAADNSEGLIGYCVVNAKNNAVRLTDIQSLTSSNTWEVYRSDLSSQKATALVITNFEEAKIKGNRRIEVTNADDDGTPALYVNGGRQNETECNKFIKSGTGITWENSPDSDINCNIDLQGTTRALRILAMCDNSQTAGNNLKGSWADLEYGSVGMPMAFTKPQIHRENRFLGQHTSDFDAKHFDPDKPDVLKSFYRVWTGPSNNPCVADPERMPLFDPIFFDPDPDAPQWFTDGVTTLEQPCQFQCPADCDNIPGVSAAFEGNEMDEAIRAGTITSGSYQTPVQWTLNRHLYRRLKEADSNSLTSPFLAFKQAHENTTVGQFFEVQRLLSDAMKFSDTDRNLVETKFAERKQKRTELAGLEYHVLVDGVPTVGSVTLAQFNLKRAEITALNGQMQAIRESYAGSFATGLAAANTLNEGITTTTVHEANQKAVNRLSISQLSVDTQRIWTVEESGLLYSIAMQCPLSGGDAVYQARALLDSTSIAFETLDLCGTSPTPKIGQSGNTNQSAVSVWPNPGSGLISIFESRHLPTWQDVKIRVFNTNGQLQKQATLPDDGIPKMLDCSHFSPGLYFGQLDYSTGEQFSFRFLIKKN